MSVSEVPGDELSHEEAESNLTVLLREEMHTCYLSAHITYDTGASFP